MFTKVAKYDNHNELVGYEVELDGVEYTYKFETEREADKFIADWCEFIGASVEEIEM